MTTFVFCGHGNFGSSLIKSLNMLLPEVTDVRAIDFDEGMDSNDLVTMIQSILKEITGPVLFICDIVGGAPFKLAAMECMNMKNAAVVGGFNLAAILEVYFQRELSLDQIIQQGQQVTCDSIESIQF